MEPELGESQVYEGSAVPLPIIVAPNGRNIIRNLFTGDGLTAFTANGRRLLEGGHDLRVFGLNADSERAVYLSSGGGVTSHCVIWPLIIVGTSTGQIDFLRCENMSNMHPPVVTGVRLWIFGQQRPGRWYDFFTRPSRDGYRNGVYVWKGCRKPGFWDSDITAACYWCRRRVPVSPSVLDAIQSITRDAGLAAHDSPCLKLPAEAWEEDHLLSECQNCRQPLRFNPFVVDNRD